jgi:hypothetical protein
MMSGMAIIEAMTGAGTSASMETRLRAMDGMSGAQIAAAFPAHSQAARDLLSSISADVHGVPLSTNVSRGTTRVSIRQDLCHMAGLTGA